MATAFNSETGTVVVIASPLEDDGHEREHLEFLAQELLGLVAGIGVLPKPISCLVHLELIATLKELYLKLAGVVEDTTQQLEAFRRGETAEEEFHAVMDRLFEDVEARVAAAAAELEELFQAAMQQMMAEAFSETLGDGLKGFTVSAAEESLMKLFGDLPPS